MKIGIDCRLWNETGVGRYIQNLVIELAKIDTKNEYVLFCLEKDVESIKNQVVSTKGSKNWVPSHSHPSPLQPLSSKRAPSSASEREGKKSGEEITQRWNISIVNIRWHSFVEQLRFPSIINRENLDLMHFPYFSVPILYRKPYVMTMHDLTISEVSTGRASTLPSPVFKTKRLAYHMVVNRALHQARKIIVPTKTVKASLVEKLSLSADKIEVTYEGVSLKGSSTNFQGSNKSQNSKIEEILRLCSGKNGEYFLYVGNAYPHKNLERLIEAFYAFSVQRLASSVQLVLVGKEDYFYKRLKEEIKRKKIDTDVIFTGYVTDDELIQLYKNARAVVVPSLMEGFGLPAVEAMSIGVPLLVSEIPVMKEVCGDVALYFDPYEISSIQKSLETMSSLSARDLKTMKDKEKKQSEKFSWQEMAEQTLQIYESSTRI